MPSKWICASVFVVGIVMAAVSHGCGGETVISPREPLEHRAKAPSCVLNDSDCIGDKYCNYDVIEGRCECMTPEMLCAIG